MAEFYVKNSKLRVVGGKSALLGLSLKEARAASLQKWATMEEYMVLHPDVSPPHDGSTYTCALCLMFAGCFCVGYPVAELTSACDCDDTPYVDYCDARKRGDRDGALAAVRAEIMFLSDLELEEEERGS